jgi:hypothetical protein
MTRTNRKAATTRKHLTRATGEFVLKLLEQPQASIHAQLIEDLGLAPAEELLACGALVRDASAKSLAVVDEAGSRFVKLDWNDQHRGYGYFDAADGFVVPPAAALQIFRLRIEWWLAWVAEELGLVNAGRPYELVGRHAWDIGDLWVTPRSKVPIIFGLRLKKAATESALRSALQSRAGRKGGVILTSTRQVAAPEWPLDFQHRCIHDLLSSEQQSFRIEIELLKGLYDGSAFQPEPNSTPLHLSPDGNVLRIYDEIIHFHSDKMKTVVRELVNAHGAQKRLRNTELREKAKIESPNFGKAFHNSPSWAAFSKHLRRKNGFCWLEV